MKDKLNSTKRSENGLMALFLFSILDSGFERLHPIRERTIAAANPDRGGPSVARARHPCNGEAHHSGLNETVFLAARKGPETQSSHFEG
jgi:hypothetical protein